MMSASVDTKLQLFVCAFARVSALNVHQIPAYIYHMWRVSLILDCHLTAINLKAVSPKKPFAHALCWSSIVNNVFERFVIDLFSVWCM